MPYQLSYPGEQTQDIVREEPFTGIHKELADAREVLAAYDVKHDALEREHEELKKAHADLQAAHAEMMKAKSASAHDDAEVESADAE